jgi:hypothetical protein
LAELLQEQRKKAITASHKVKLLEEEQERLDKQCGDLASAIDDAKDRVDIEPPLSGDERAALAQGDAVAGHAGASWESAET